MIGVHRFGGVLAFILAAVTPVSAQQAVPAGHIKTVTGAAFVLRQNATIEARPGEAVFASDVLRTSVGVIETEAVWDDAPASRPSARPMRLSNSAVDKSSPSLTRKV